jgi:hypothetical protein
VLWLWTRGALLAKPQVGWTAGRGCDPDVLCAAALHGHTAVVRLLVKEVGLKFCKNPTTASAVSNACSNGHDETLATLIEC